MKALRAGLFFASVAVFLAVSSVTATPARKGLFKKVQKDGAVILYERVGDEYFHYTRSSEGYTLAEGKDGDFYYAELSKDGAVVPSEVSVRPLNLLSPSQRRSAEMSRGLVPLCKGRMETGRALGQRLFISPFRTITSGDIPDVNSIGGWGGEKTGDFRTLVILVNYSDLQFTVQDAAASFSSMLNDAGYSENGAVGSAGDFFDACSNGRFHPVFDVAGPYTLPEKMSFYGGDKDARAAQMALKACALADADIDFSKYSEGGIIRNVYIYYAGYNEAEGGPEDSVWPHQWTVWPGYNVPSGSNVTFDGVELQGYACSSEFRGNAGGVMSGIGSVCHEFGHVIGLPDFYDTDGTDNGSCEGLGVLSVMDVGCYLGDGCSPPVYGTLERWMLGWTKPVLISEPGEYVLEPVYGDRGYIMMSPTAGEFFLLDNRRYGLCNWDRVLLDDGGTDASGMLVYHIDETDASVSFWANNLVNSYSNNQCVVPLKADYDKSLSYWFFPGAGGHTALLGGGSPSLADRLGNPADFFLVDIREEGDNIRFRAADKLETVTSLVADTDSVFVGVVCSDTVNVVQEPATSFLTEVRWYSADEKVASVNMGVIKGVSAGRTFVVCENTYNNNAKDTVFVKVFPGAFDLKGDAGQYDLTLSWSSFGGFDSWDVQCFTKTGVTALSSASTAGLAVNLQGLSPGTDYVLKLVGTGADGAAAGPFFFTMNTEDKDKSAQASFGEIPDGCTTDDEVTLRLKNVGTEVDGVAWTIDGKPAASTIVRFTAGRHKITAKIRNGSEYDYLVKYITVK